MQYYCTFSPVGWCVHGGAGEGREALLNKIRESCVLIAAISTRAETISGDWAAAKMVVEEREGEEGRGQGGVSRRSSQSRSSTRAQPGDEGQEASRIPTIFI